ncbi:hypothetical protein Fmac_008654 [Flemingia macrophylla]|uniref:Uncharacterized protein n=1 Tax=Flemingia macrophylla TaxID=520843 RepID=A0ABD1MXZ4_9FABA
MEIHIWNFVGSWRNTVVYSIQYKDTNLWSSHNPSFSSGLGFIHLLPYKKQVIESNLDIKHFVLNVLVSLSIKYFGAHDRET